MSKFAAHQELDLENPAPGFVLESSWHVTWGPHYLLIAIDDPETIVARCKAVSAKTVMVKKTY